MKDTCPLLPTGIAAVLSIYEDEYLTGTRVGKRVYPQRQNRSCASDTCVDKRRIAPCLLMLTDVEVKLR